MRRPWPWIAAAAVTTAAAVPLGLTQGSGKIDVFVGSTPTAAAAQGCTGVDVTTGTFSSRISGSTNGDTLCLLNGSYGQFTGTNKTITILAKTGQTSVSMSFSFGSGDTGFTLDGMIGMSGTIGSGATDITIKNATFSRQGTTGAGVDISGATTHGIVIEDSDFSYTGTSTGNAYKIALTAMSGTVGSPAFTLSRSDLSNSDFDAVNIGGNNVSGIVIEDSEFGNLCDTGQNHTDAIQFGDIDPGASDSVIRRNYVHTPAGCDTQAITSFDGGTAGVIIEDNVVDIADGRGNGIELYADGNGTSVGSTVRHNTLIFHPPPCVDNPSGCGGIQFTSKYPGGLGPDPQGCCSQVYDNLATDVEVISGKATVAANHHNGCHISTCTGTGSLANLDPDFVDATPTQWSDYCLAPGSDGENAASDGLDMGIRC